MSSRPASVAVLVYDVDPRGGGMERQAARLAARLAAGRRVRLLAATQPGLLKLPERGFTGVEEGVPALRTPLVVHELVAGAALARASAPWDALYAVGLTMGTIAARIARALDTPVVLKLACGGVHGDAFALENHPSRDKLRALLLERVARFVCPSREIEDEWRALGVPPEKLARIANGVDLSTFGARERRDGPRRVLFVGRLDEQKRPDLLVRAFARVRTTHELWLVGGGPLREVIERLAASLGVADRVKLLGPRSDVPDLLAGSDLFVLPSAGEGVSNALLEALASRVPSIASAIAPNREVLEDGAGLLVPLDDEEALAGAIERVLGDEKLALDLGRAGRARVEAAYDLDAVARRYGELFDAVAAARPAAPSRSRATLLARLLASRVRG